MTRPSLSTGNYAAVIEDLRAKRAEIDLIIAGLEELAQLRGRTDSKVHQLKQLGAQPDVDQSMPIGDACVAVLRSRPFPMSNRQKGRPAPSP